HSHHALLLSRLPRPPVSTHFPYTTLFRSPGDVARHRRTVPGRLCRATPPAAADRRRPASVARDDGAGDRLHAARWAPPGMGKRKDRKSTRLNSSHRTISYAVFCLKKKKDM